MHGLCQFILSREGRNGETLLALHDAAITRFLAGELRQRGYIAWAGQEAGEISLLE